MSAGLTMSPCAFAAPVTKRKIARIESINLPRGLFIAVKSLSVMYLSKSRRRVDPQHPSFLAPRIPPAVRNRAFKIKAVAGLQPVMLAPIKPNFKIAPKDMQEFLAFVRIGLAAAPAGLHPKKMRFHRRVAPGKQFHAHVRRRFQNFPFGRPH